MIASHEHTEPPRAMTFGRPTRSRDHVDLQLVSRMLSGDREAFSEFTDSLVPGLYRYAAARLGGDRELTRDIVQTTVCKILSKLDSYRGEASLLTWLCACCRNEIAMHFRRQGSRPQETPLEEEDHSTLATTVDRNSPSPDQGMLQRESAAWVHATLDQLPDHYARSLEWKYVDRLSVADIATRLDLSPKATESLLTRARGAFKSRYRQLIQELESPVRVESDGRLEDRTPNHD
ncbi:MAG: sigma-70 family RNA polymerase sigma factor [Thermoanaerobaculia bacterium]|nr:sigma-70 family RNA polymerase sigma factor [Thermoanaerobaculia bacterium]